MVCGLLRPVAGGWELLPHRFMVLAICPIGSSLVSAFYISMCRWFVFYVVAINEQVYNLRNEYFFDLSSFILELGYQNNS